MKKILAAHDGSDAADRAMFEAITISQKFGSNLTIVSVIPNLCFTEIGTDCETIRNLYKAEVEGILDGIKDILREKDIDAETVMLEGNPADKIVDYAKSNDMDLIVIGSTGKDATERTLLGSVSSRVAANASCSVLIVR